MYFLRIYFSYLPGQNNTFSKVDDKCLTNQQQSVKSTSLQVIVNIPRREMVTTELPLQLSMALCTVANSINLLSIFPPCFG